MRLFLLAFLLGSGLFAHPHIFVDVFMEIDVDEKKRMDSTIIWRFDPMVTQQFVMDFDMDGSGNLDSDETEELKAATFDTLEGVNYFTRVKVGKEFSQTGKLRDFEAYIENERLHYKYKFDKKQDLSDAQKAIVTCYDPEFYISMVLEKEWVTLNNKSDDDIRPTVKIAKSPNGFVYALQLKAK